MKISIKGRMKNNKINIGYRMLVLSMIKKVLSEFDQEYFEKMFFYEGKKTKSMKPFSFSVYLEDYRIQKDFIEVNGDVKIIVSSPDKKLSMILLNGFMKLKSHDDFIKKDVRLEKERKIMKNDILMKTLSPIYIKGKDGKALSIDDQEYNKEFNYFANLVLKSYRGYGLKQTLEFTPLNMKKVVVKEAIREFKEKTDKKFMYFNAYSGVFNLKGDIDDLNLLKELGVGARRSGFGTIDLL